MKTDPGWWRVAFSGVEWMPVENEPAASTLVQSGLVEGGVALYEIKSRP